MSYRSRIRSLPTILRKALRDPSYIAGIASVGIHGLLWVVLPILPSSSSELDEPEIQRPVSLVELSPAEQSRLPDFSTPQVTLPPIPSQSDLYSLSPVPNNFTPIPNQPVVPQYPDLSSLFNNSPLPPPPSTFRFPQYPLPSSRPSIQIQPSPRPSTTPAPRQNPPQPPPSDQVPESPGAQAINPNIPSPSAEQSPAPSPGSTPSGTQTPPSRIARALEDQQRLREQYRQLFTFNPEGTRAGSEQEQSLSWFDGELRAPVDDIDNVPEISIQAAVPREACSVRLERDPRVWLGVVVNAEGNVVAQPKKFRGSGYAFFDQKALEVVAGRRFENGSGDKPDYAIGDNRVYFVTVTFNREQSNCPGAATPAPSPAS